MKRNQTIKIKCHQKSSVFSSEKTAGPSFQIRSLLTKNNQNLKKKKTTSVCIIAGENYTLESKNTAQQLNTGHQLGHLPQYLDTEMFSPNHGGYTG